MVPAWMNGPLNHEIYKSFILYNVNRYNYFIIEGKTYGIILVQTHLQLSIAPKLPEKQESYCRNEEKRIFIPIACKNPMYM